MPDDIEVGRMAYKRGDELVFKVSDYKGQDYFSIRAIYRDAGGNQRYTKEGIHMHVNSFEEFYDLITKLKKIIDERQPEEDAPKKDS